MEDTASIAKSDRECTVCANKTSSSCGGCGLPLCSRECQKLVLITPTYEDEAAAARISAKNGLESYTYSLRSSIDGDFKDKLDASDKEALEKAISETKLQRFAVFPSAACSTPAHRQRRFSLRCASASAR
ncbi:hypothetical protein JCM10213_007884 [Rhodosporidiobolus nylandii]